MSTYPGQPSVSGCVWMCVGVCGWCVDGVWMCGWYVDVCGWCVDVCGWCVDVCGCVWICADGVLMYVDGMWDVCGWCANRRRKLALSSTHHTR